MRGSLNENLIIAKIQQKCDIERDPQLDHKHKLDFVINRFRLIEKKAYIGVQLTMNPYDTDKQRQFLRERQKGKYVDRSIYIKVNPEVDIDDYGSELIYNAIVAFAFQKELKKKQVLGVEIMPDVTYAFFELAGGGHQHQSTAHPHRQPAPQSSGPRPVGVNGTIVKYFPDRGFGFIESDNGGFFFHISDVTDEALREKILPGIESLIDDPKLESPISIIFDDGGFTRTDAEKPSAKNVHRAELPPELGEDFDTEEESEARQTEGSIEDGQPDAEPSSDDIDRDLDLEEEDGPQPDQLPHGGVIPDYDEDDPPQPKVDPKQDITRHPYF